MLLTTEYAEEIAKDLLCKFLDAQDRHNSASKLAKGSNKDTPFRNSIRELKCITFQDVSIRYAHMRIMAEELRSSLEDYRWN
jgi:hypothetical protein